jgi:predicted glycosyltransferase
MPDTVRDYLHAFSILVTAGAGAVGLVMLRAALTLDQHLAAAVVLVIAGVALFVAYKLKPKETVEELKSTSETKSRGQDEQRAT